MLTHSVLTLFTSGNTFSPACMWLITGSSWTVFSEHSLSQSSTEHSVDRPKCTRESTFSSFRSHIKNVHKKKHQTATPPRPVSAVPSLIHCLLTQDRSIHQPESLPHSLPPSPTSPDPLFLNLMSQRSRKQQVNTQPKKRHAAERAVERAKPLCSTPWFSL